MKRILDSEYDDPMRMVYHEILKYEEEINWANDVIGLRKKYNLSYENIKNMQMNDWKSVVKSFSYKEHSWSFRLNAPMTRRPVIFHMNIFKLVITSLVSPQSKQNWHLKLKLACLT